MIPIKSAARGAEQTLGSIMQEIGDLIGMNEIKGELNELIALGRLVALRRDRDIPLEKVSLHLVFTGPPGTGKTIMARKIGKLFKAIGLLPKGHCIEVDRSKLVGAYLGETGKIVTDKFQEAIGGVLFIDEAYALAGSGTALGRGDQYGTEAIQTLLTLMENYRDRVVVIVAGYSGPMRRFMDNNEGLKSRFTRTFVFKSYTHDEMFEIFRFMLNEGGYTIDAPALKEAEKYIKTFDRDREDFGNAREVRSFFERLLPAQAMRFAGVANMESLTNAELLTITADDVRNAAKW